MSNNGKLFTRPKGPTQAKEVQGLKYRSLTGAICAIDMINRGQPLKVSITYIAYALYLQPLNPYHYRIAALKPHGHHNVYRF